MTLVVNRAAVDAAVARRRVIREREFARWVATRLGASLAALYALAFLVRALTPSPRFVDMDGWHRALFFAVPFVMACFIAFAAERLTFGGLGLDAERLSKRIGREVGLLTSPGWPLRILGAAVLLAICIGVPLATLIYATGQPTMIARGSDAGIVIFVSSVLLLCLALAFGLRAVTLIAYRDVVTRV